MHISVFLSNSLIFFFFSSRRRHTRWPRVWSSDVCSSDLQGLDDLSLGHRLDHLAFDEDLALAVAAGHAEVGITGLARSVDHAPHDRHPQRDLHALEAGGDRKSTRLNSSHVARSYAGFCLKNNKHNKTRAVI